MDKKWKWEIDLEGLVGLFCRIETTDGVVREGRITGTEVKTFLVNGNKIDIPVAVSLNYDSADKVHFDRMRDITLR